MNKSFNLYDSAAIGVSQNKAKVYTQVLLQPGDIMQIGTAFSTCDRVILDIKAIANTKYAPTPNSTKESVRYYLNESNPFDIIIDAVNPLKAASTIRGLISYNRSKNIIEINTGTIFDRGFFNFSVKLNFCSDGITRGKTTKQQPIIKIKPTSNAEKLFDGLQVRVEKTGSPSKDAIVIDEYKRFAQNNLFKFSVVEKNFGYDPFNIRYTGSGEFKFDENVNVKNVIITNFADVYLPPGYPIVSIYDRVNAPRLEGGLQYYNNHPKLYTSITHSQYFTTDAIGFYDQTVRRTLVGDQDQPGEHPLVSIRDVFSAVESHSNIPVLHFRREYTPIENTNNGKAPYHFYFCPKFVNASDKIAECISVELNRSASEEVSVEISIKNRSLTNISLESKTTLNKDGNIKVYYGQLNISVPSFPNNNSFKYGKSKVFHSDLPNTNYISDSVYGITVMDVMDALHSNIGGNINESSAQGTGSTTHTGFIPTFKELGLFSSNQNSPVVQFFPGRNLRACALMAAARLWNGNTDKSKYSARSELEAVTVKGKYFRTEMYCRGLAQGVDLSNFVAIAPLCRALTTAFVRGEIKSFDQHLSDGDFTPIENDGPGYNRFYKYDTISKSMNVISYGENYFSSILKLPNNESSNMTCGGPATATKHAGESRRLFGSSQIGVAFDLLGNSFEDETGFFENTPAYMISHIGLKEISNVNVSNFTKKLTDMSGGILSISLNYRHNTMFPGPYSYTAKQYVPSPVEYGINEYGEDPNDYYNGGIFHVLYSTSGKGSHVSGVNDISAEDNIKYSLSLDPFYFDNDALLICEGGDEKLPPKRKIQINNSMQWLSSAPERSKILSAFIRKDMIDWAKTRNWQLGNTIKIKFDSSYQNNYRGTLSITGSGKKQITSYLDYDVDNDMVSYSSNLGESMFIGKTISAFADAHQNTFAGVLTVNVSSVFNSSAILPYHNLVFNRIVSKLVVNRPIVDFLEPNYSNPYSDNPYSTNPYSSNLYSDNPYSANPYYSAAFTAGSYEILSYNSQYYSSNFEDAYVLSPYAENPYYNAENPYYNAENPYYINPYSVSSPIDRGLLTVYVNEVIRPLSGGLEMSIDVINQSNYPRSYSFYLNNPRYNSVQDIINDINNRLSDLGITAESLVSNPNAYSVQRIAKKQIVKLVNADYIFSRTETYNQTSSSENPYNGISTSPYEAFLFTDTFISNSSSSSYPEFDIISSINPYSSINSYNSINGYQESIAAGPYNSVFDMVSPYGYAVNPYSNEPYYAFNPYSNEPYYTLAFPPAFDSGDPVVSVDVVDSLVPVISYDRIRIVESFESEINIDNDVYDSQFNQPESIYIKFVGKSTDFYSAGDQVSAQGRPRDIIGLSDLSVPSTFEFTSAPNDDARFSESSNFGNQNITSPFKSSAFVGNQSNANTPSSISGLEIAYGGVISGGAVTYNQAPNTYFSNSEQSGLGDIQFRTVDADFAIILIRVAYQDGKYGPTNFAAASIIESIKANVTYNSSASPEVLSAEFAPAQTIESISYTDANGQTVEYSLFPAMIKIPLKAAISYVSIFMSDANVSANVKIIDAPSSLNNFGFLAVNKNNPNYDMGTSKDGQTFGLVLDNYGFWDILIAPEASIQTVYQGEFSFNGRGYHRTPGDTDDKFIAGIGTPIISPIDNDITGFDKTMIPSAIRDAITLIPVPGYQQVWVLRIDPAVKSYLLAIRKASGGRTQDGCYVDIPIYFQASITEAVGTCNVRIFNNVSCVFDYKFCDFFWNLGSPLDPPAAFSIQDDIEVSFIEYLTCEGSTRIFNENGIDKVEIISYFIMNFDKMPMLDNGTGLLLIKADTSSSAIVDIFNPTNEVILQLKTPNNSNPSRPWEFNCSTVSGVDSINKTILYTNPQNYSEYTYNSSEIATKLKTEKRFLLVQPKFKFPLYDENGASSPKEKVVASIGFVYQDWRPSATDFWSERMIFGVKFVIPSGQIQVNLLQNFSIRFLYNEDRKLL